MDVSDVLDPSPNARVAPSPGVADAAVAAVGDAVAAAGDGAASVAADAASAAADATGAVTTAVPDAGPLGGITSFIEKGIMVIHDVGLG
jgi:hypothetical protein